MSEQDWLQHLETLDAAEFAAALARPNALSERALRTYFGPETFERLRTLASGGHRGSRGANVVVLHGIMGGELTYYPTPADPEPLWLKALSLIRGRFKHLPLNPDGTSRHPVEATGILKRYYGEQLLTLVDQGWNVHAHWYDWRMDVRRSADILASRINEWFGDAPVHLVAHSMGGLVARAFIHRHQDLWARMWDAEGNGASGGRLVMLGTPNHGSLKIPQMLFGLNGTVRKLALVDVHHSLRELLDIIKTFTGALQMLPSPQALPGAEVLFRAGTYAPLRVEQSCLDAALRFQEELAADPATVDPARMIYVAGYDQPTYTGVSDWSRLSSLDAYKATREGDGTVPHALGLLAGVPVYYAAAEHGALPCHTDVLRTLSEILETGNTPLLETMAPQTNTNQDDAVRALELKREREEAVTLETAAPLKSALRSAESGAEPQPSLTDTEPALEDLLACDFAGARHIDVPRASIPLVSTASLMGSAGRAGTVSIRLSSSPIQDLDAIDDPPVDAIAVGHYIGVRPAGAELALDNAISEVLGGPGLLRSFTERGILRGAIGQPFFLADPRQPERIIVIAGMGYPGRFGVPELTAVARDLIWSAARLGKRHLAAVLVGSGEGNLTVRDAVRGWLNGLRRTFTEAHAAQLEAITFVEPNPAKLLAIQRALAAEAETPGGASNLEIRTLDERVLEQAAREDAVARARASMPASADGWDLQARSAHATRLTVELEDDVYRYGAVSETAAVAERRITLDPDLVNEANDALAAAADSVTQAQLGQYLLKLLLPADLRRQLASAHPLVVICDAATARVHWEAIAQPGLAGVPGAGDVAFLGIHRGLTRQLRTEFAPQPEPAPQPGRILRVLIAADTSSTEPLPGARREGELVRDLFFELRKQELAKPLEQRNVAEVEVTALIGPAQATRARIMQELLLRPYDILHYAGHCVYDCERPAASGWRFSNGKRLGAQELGRLDEFPKFVFANACQSGITPDRSGRRSAGLAPGFAESFFARGVQNFICTGWPVKDVAALDFAEAFYTGILGLRGRLPEPMHVAMRAARARVFQSLGGRGSWGAYQHYGDPYALLVAGAREEIMAPMRAAMRV